MLTTERDKQTKELIEQFRATLKHSQELVERLEKLTEPLAKQGE